MMSRPDPVALDNKPKHIRILPATGLHLSWLRKPSALTGLVRMACLLAAISWQSAVAVTTTAVNGLSCAGARIAQNMNCNAGEFTTTVAISPAPGSPTTCTAGQYLILNGSIEMENTKPNRYNIGFFTGEAGNDPRQSGGQCSVATFPTSPAPWNDYDGNACGDFEARAADTPIVENMRVLCQGNADGDLLVPYVLSYQQVSQACTGPADVTPGSPSKCNSGTAVVTGIRVMPSITKTDGVEFVSPGASTIYIVEITNTTGFALSDLKFLDPAVAGITVTGVSCSAYGGASCPSGGSSTLRSGMQGSGLTIASMPANSRVVFTINATLNGTIGTILTNTASVTIDSSTMTASDYTTLGSAACSSGDLLFYDDFDRASLGSDWTVANSSGSFGDPRIISDRLRLTNNTGNVATAATLQRLFPGAGNKIVLEFDYYAYDGTGNDDADGVAVTFSDGAVTPIPGGYGGSLGYAQRCGINGFAGGWLGIGVDEYGNFRNDEECRGDGPPPTGRVRDSVSVRGSGSGTSGYRLLGESGGLSPGVDMGSSTVGPGHRYRVTIDHLTNPSQANYRVERRTTAGGSWATLVSGNALAAAGQAAVPANWIISYTGSTGGQNNIHEIDNVMVCATKMQPVTTSVNHFRFYHDGSALTCAPENIQVRACLDSTCSAEASGPITATLTPSGWLSGNPVTFTSGDTLQLQHTTAEVASLGVSSSTPSALNTSRCYVGGVLQANCNLTFHDAGFVFDVPDHNAAVTQDVIIKAVRKDDETQKCVPGFQSVTKTVNFWSSYIIPNTGGQAISINSTDIAGAGPGTGIDLAFDNDGTATLQVNYPDVGQMQLDASYAGSGQEAGLLMTGQDLFVARPDHFTLGGIVCADGTVNPAAADAAGGAFCRAGQNFTVTVAARNASGGITPNYGREATPESAALVTALVAPSGGAVPALAGAFGSFGQDCSGNSAASGTACGTFSWPEVGIVTLTPHVADGNYLGAGDVTGTVSGNVGRFYPASFGVAHTAAPACGGTFTYAGITGSKAGQPFTVTGTATARNLAGNTTTNYSGAFVKLTTGNIQATPRQGAGAAAGNITWGVDALTFAAGVGTFTENDARYAFTSEGAPQNMHLRVSATDSDGATGSEDDATKAIEYRFGRLHLQNAYGPELMSIALPLQAEYYTAGGYYGINSLDGCTALALATHLELSTDNGASWVSGDTTVAVGGGTTTASLLSIPLAGGDAGLSFSAPGAGNTGTVDVRTAVSATHPWLLYDWDGDGAHDNESTARMTFGIYKGSPRHIYLRERY